MKKIVFTLALLAASTVVFANSNTVENKAVAVKDCKITIKDNQTGKSHTITVHGESCGSLLKDLF